MSILIRPTSAGEWREIRDIRLRMLLDTPLAFGETWESASGLDDAAWRERAVRWAPPHSVSYVAITDRGDWVGVMRCYLEGGSAHLVGVYVDPEWRGRENGVADLLLDAVVEWASDEAEELRLHVHESNPRATAFYRRRGFRSTGASEPHEVPPFGVNHEYVLSWGDVAP